MISDELAEFKSKSADLKKAYENQNKAASLKAIANSDWSALKVYILSYYFDDFLTPPFVSQSIEHTYRSHDTR